MGRKFRDYDQAWAERDNKPIPFGLILGEKVTLPPALPARVALDAKAMSTQHDDDENVPIDKLADLAAKLFTRERVDRWLEGDMDLPTLAELIRDGLDCYSDTDDTDGDGEGDADPPDPAPSTSSTDGPPSNPTLPASTTTT